MNIKDNLQRVKQHIVNHQEVYATAVVTLTTVTVGGLIIKKSKETDNTTIYTNKREEDYQSDDVILYQLNDQPQNWCLITDKTSDLKEIAKQIDSGDYREE